MSVLQGCSVQELKIRFPEVYELQDKLPNVNRDGHSPEPSFELIHVNDFSQEQIKAEHRALDEQGEIPNFSVCAAIHGGPLDYPKAVSKAVGLIVSKWDHCFDQLEEAHRKENNLVRSQSDEEVFATLTEHKNPDGELDDMFYSTISESASKIFVYNFGLVKKLLSGGDMFSLLRVYSSLALVRNKLWYYNIKLQVPGMEKPFDDQYVDFTQLMESLSEQILEYHTSLIATTILHDPESHIFNNSLGILTTRYYTVVPNSSRLEQYRGDILAILNISSEVLTFVSSGIEDILGASSTNPVALEIHTKCNLLLSAAAIKASPLSIYTKVGAHFQKPNKKRKNVLPDAQAKTYWLHLIQPELFPANFELIEDNHQLFLVTKLIANQAEPSWPLLINAMMTKDCAIAKLITLHFGAFIPGTLGGGEQVHHEPKIHCNGYGCDSQCVGTADVGWPQAVGSATLKVCSEVSRNPMILVNILDPLLVALSLSSWEAMDRGNIWNPRKPVWFQALIQLLDPFVVPIVQELLDLMEAGKAWTIGQVPATRKTIITNLQDIVPIIPISVLKLCKRLDEIVPKPVRPLSKSTLSQLLVCSLYGIIEGLQPWLRRRKFSREKIDFVLAFNEALCQIDTCVEVLNIQQSADITLQESLDKNPPGERIFEVPSHEFFTILSAGVANEILSTPEGSQSLKVLYRFFCYNSDWILSALKVGEKNVTSEGTIPVLIKPWGSEIYPPQNPYEMMNQIGGFAYGNTDGLGVVLDSNGNSGGCGDCINPCLRGSQITFEKLLKVVPPWEDYLKHVLAYNNPMVNLRLAQLRPEVRDDSKAELRRQILDSAEDILTNSKK
ncbi:LOW QUALITY PROTEIN: uncharacterized protein LOC131889983 [Tigriopus californicus]|uniref:LOW QUALITY PROTEIN: uncharacterized protein LOC131889983 n=1 Tax=Tigriopus californicus TaxID=6832 RepID=UPI0027DA5EFE|nr:LOW QUALITY PROTEIN: uncharacterized protein LOC131889983 [Tigriopus californicus]